MILQEIHERGLAKTIALSQYYVANMITPIEVIRVLNKAKISFVLVGLHGLVAWMREPRATEDVDVIVALRQHQKAKRVLLKAFPELEAIELEVVTRFRMPGTETVLIDVMKPNQQPHREVFKNTRTVQSEGETYRIPSLEMALTMKFAPMISLTRAEEDKHQDAHDFIHLAKQNPDIDLVKLASLGETIYSGGGAEIVELVRKARAGERMRL